MKEQFISWNPNAISKKLIEITQEIFDSYREMGYKLTLRQLYYQLVKGNLLPDQWIDPKSGSANNEKSYKKFGNIVSKGRLAGMLDWEMIEDRNRSVIKNSHWSSPKDILFAAADQFYLSRWENQDNYVFIMAEKDAVSNIAEPVCKKWDVSFLANKGYNSQSAIYDLYNILKSKLNDGKIIHCIYLGDFDPSGIDMDRDIRDRLNLFLGTCGEKIAIERIALTEAQIRQYSPPENPAKITDSRYKKYIKKYGKSSWELDALDISDMERIIETAILKYMDMAVFDEIAQNETLIKKDIHEFASKY